VVARLVATWLVPGPAGVTVAFFDMDHTVLTIDTSMSWMHFRMRRGELSRGYLGHVALCSLMYRLALLDLDGLADRLVADLEGQSEHDFISKTQLWHRLHVAPFVAPGARRAIDRHRQRGDRLVLLTGSNHHAARNVADMLGLDDSLATELEVRHGRFTGRVAQRCFGSHKVEVATRWARQHDVDLSKATFYSDSYNDRPMLERVAVPVAVDPDPRLARHASRVGWRVERWRSISER
jgi:HAD superfamily hydrolase (TIGR01490 family)